MPVTCSRSTAFGVLLALTVGLGAIVGCAAPAAGEELGASGSASSTNDARTRLRTAIDAKETVDARLVLALGRVGPMLTEAQLRRFIADFQARPEMASVYAAYTEGAEDLARELASVLHDEGRLARVMAEGRRSRADLTPASLYASFEMIASTPNAGISFEFAVRLLQNDPALAAVARDPVDVVRNILLPAMPNAFLALLMQTGSLSQASAELLDVMGSLKDNADGLATWLTLGAKTRAPAFELAGQSVTPALNTISGMISIWKILESGLSFDAQGFVTQLGLQGPGAVAGIADGLAHFRRYFLGADHSPGLHRITQVAGRLSGGIAALTSVIGLSEDLKLWDRSASAKIRVGADLVGIASGLLAAFAPSGIGAPIAAATSLGLVLIASALESAEDAAREEQAKADLRVGLPRAGAPASLVDTMIAADPTLVAQLGHGVGLDATAFQWLIGVAPSTVAWSSLDGPHVGYGGVVWLKELFALDGPGAADLLRAVVGGESDPVKREAMIDLFVRGAESIKFELTRAEALAELERVSAPGAGDDEHDILRKRALQNARAFLAGQ